LITKSNAELCINAKIVLDCNQTVFSRNLAEFRVLDAFAEERAMLWMDHCLSQITSVVL
jgi:hypothetical protein